MSTVATKNRYTAKDLLSIPDGDRYELVAGKLVERNVSYWSSYIAGAIHRLLSTFCLDNKRGWVSPEGTSFQCFPDDPQKVRRADVSFIRLDRMTSERATQEGHMPIAPDLAVEVVSPNDLYYQVETKTEDWLSAGVQIVWIVNPRTHTVTVRRADGSSTTLRENDDLTGENIVPGFRCQVRELFLLPTEAAPTA
jgi:Uma2 family endonuclease